ncbi:PHP domain-containing protein [Prochlorococcus sp. MIT 1307]|uniref:PHP domain-containing protein n=1 Tax=Prochlorococcus sp. MIT 1307 TaxID=3096219 RepID=UPI002A760DA4|nr:PHP domain-containing protein [Prochlorococcus sp. MIT 1307]
MSNLQDLRKILSSIGPNSCPEKINLHCHTLFSDGSLSPESLIYQACQRNLNHLSITDHHTVKAYNAIYRWLDLNQSCYRKVPKIWSGIEISCLLKNCLVHVIGLGFDLSNKALFPYTRGESPNGKYLEAPNVVKAIREAGGLIVLAHPARYRLPYFELIAEAARLGFDGGEAWYDYEHSTPWKPTPLVCESINNQLKSLNLLTTCGTDSHGYDLSCR